MCGIVGFTGKKNIHKLSQLLALVGHRGRDGKTPFYADGVHLGMNRLAIIDLTHNPHPLKYKQYTLVFNGEIYNHKEIRKRLRKKGVRFGTACDAEVILPMFDLYGPRAFSMLEGMFAIALYDSAKKRLVLARDKSGEKPLYIANNPFSFASEIKVLLRLDKRANALNKAALSEYLTHGSVLAPQTLALGIRKLPPSTYMVYDTVSQKETVRSYWDPTKHIRLSLDTSGEADYAGRLEVLLRHSVKLRLEADVPVGCFLSGGIDSSLVTYFASREKPNIQTYSVSFPGYDDYDESRFASLIAQKLQTRHTVVECTAKNIRSLIDQIGTLIDEPIVDPAVLPTLLLAKEARKQVKVVLTGEGADELFGGYDRYRNQLAVERLRHVGGRLPLFLESFSLSPIRRFRNISKHLVERYSAQSVWNKRDLEQLLIGGRQLFHLHYYLRRYAETNPLLSMQLTDYRGYMAEQLLMKIDKSTMAENLEARAPYLDTKIISFAFGLPPNQKIRYLHGKYILKKVAERHFPKSFVWRAKHGFDIPLREWFRDELRDYVDRSIECLGEYANMFRVDYYKHIVDEHMDKNHDHSGKIWSILVLVRWMKGHNISV